MRKSSEGCSLKDCGSQSLQFLSSNNSSESELVLCAPDLQPKPPLGLLIILSETAACIKRCRIAELQGHSCCTVDTWVLLTWPDVLEALGGAHVDGCGYGNMHQLWKRHLQATAETPVV